MNRVSMQDELYSIEDEMTAEDFVALCRREATMFPRPHIEDVVCKRIVSRDFVAGCTDHCSESAELPSHLCRQASS